MSRINLHTTVDKDLVKKLKFVALEQDKNMNDLLEEAITDLLEKYSKK